MTRGLVVLLGLLVAGPGQLAWVATASAAVLWHEDFEGVPCGALPAEWVHAGGNTDYGVDCTVACGGNRSFREFGVINGSWAATVGSPIDPGLSYVPEFWVEFTVQNGSEDILPGPHDIRANIQMRPEPHWTAPAGRVIFRAAENGALTGADGVTVIGHIAHETCHTVRIGYTRNVANVQFDYWLDGGFSGTVIVPLKANEDQLVWFLWETGAGSVWYDDITVTIPDLGLVADYGDAPLPYPDVSHDIINEEWLGAILPGTTTAEPGALIPDLDADDAGPMLYCTAPPVGGVCHAIVALPVGVAAGAPAGLRRLNVVIDMNRNGVFGDVVPFREHVIQDLPLNVATNSIGWAVIRGVKVENIIVGADMWVRATLTRDPIGIANWNGAGDFDYGETEDRNLLTVNNGGPAPWPVGGVPNKPGECSGLGAPSVKQIDPNPVKTPPVGSPHPKGEFNVKTGPQGLAFGGCRARVDIFNCRPHAGSPGPGPNISKIPFESLLAAHVALYLGQAKIPPPLPNVPPPGAGIFGGAGRASSDAFVTLALGTNHIFKSSYPDPPADRTWLCTVASVFDPDGLAVTTYDVTDSGQGYLEGEVVLIEDSEDSEDGFPAASSWGMVVVALLLLAGITIKFAWQGPNRAA